MPMEVGDGQEGKMMIRMIMTQLMYTQNVETIEPFSSRIVPVKTGRVYLCGECINVMVQNSTNSGWLFASWPYCTEYMYTELRERQ